MYHEVTYAQVRRQQARRVAAVLLCVALVVGGWFASRVLLRGTHEQAALSAREAIVAAARSCAGVEGSYPRSVAYLQEHYGLVLNETDYVVYYEWLGANVPPSVVVTPR